MFSPEKNKKSACFLLSVKTLQEDVEASCVSQLMIIHHQKYTTILQIKNAEHV